MPFAESRADASEKDLYFAAELPGTSQTIHIHADVIEHLSFDATEALKAVPRRGLEIGGILLGKINANS